MSKLFGKTDFKRMRYPVYVILMALTMFYLGKNSFRNIALILRTVMNIQVSHTTISNWCARFAPMFQNIALQIVLALNFNCDEWHADETVVKIQGEKYYLWLILDSETRFVLGFHLSRHRDSPQAFTILEAVKPLGKPQAIVSDRYFAYRAPVKTLHEVQHIRVESFHDDILPTTSLSVSTSSSRLVQNQAELFFFCFCQQPHFHVPLFLQLCPPPLCLEQPYPGSVRRPQSV